MCDFNVHGLFDNLNILSSVMSFLIRDSFLIREGLVFYCLSFRLFILLVLA